MTIFPHVVDAFVNAYGNPTDFVVGNMRILHQIPNLQTDFEDGDFVKLNGYASVSYRPDANAPVLKLSPAASNYLIDIIETWISTYQFVGGDTYANPAGMLEYVKKDLDFLPDGFNQDDWKEKHSKAKLTLDESNQLNSITDEQIIQLVQLRSKRQFLFSDELSLWGFTDDFSNLQRMCHSG